jgi:thiol-disulfide isomerase/thioredoxin
MVRLLGLNYLRKTEPQLAVPILIPLLDDRDLRVVAEAEVALMRWSGEDYGVRARLALPSQEGIHSATVDPANVETIRRGIDQRKEWWRRHQQEFPVSVMAPQLSAVEPGRPPVADFALENLEGHKVRLSDFRGKVVLLNFWATWCTACLAEIPDLVALQKMNDNHIVILGVALDGVPDEHGHIHREGGHGESLGLKAVHSKIARTVKSRGINYPVLLDAGNSVGSQFNGGELPTTIVIDAEGRIRRRFIGERNLQVFQAMLAEAAKPLGSSRTAAR